MTKKILLINDIAGYGKVALSAMIPVLSHLGLDISTLPTALVSNTLDYGKFEILDTTDYIQKTLQIWDQLGFCFDAISTGFIVSERQVQMIYDECQKRVESGTLIFVDPIMGDEGSLYPGVSEKTVDYMKKLVGIAHISVPNYTEACYLTGITYQKEGISLDEANVMLQKMRDLGCRSVVITSVKMAKEDVVIGYDHRQEETFFLPFDMIPVRFPGTGDIFSSVLIGHVLNGLTLKESTQRAMTIVRNMIAASQDNSDKLKGISIEALLGGISYDKA